MIRCLLFFGIRNELPFWNIGYYANVGLKIISIGFGLTDLLSTEKFYLKIVYGILFLVN